MTAWTTGGNVPDATIKLTVTPAGGGTASFSFGCGTSDGTSACDLGTVDAASVKRQLQAQVAIPSTAVTVTSVTLTATASASGLRTDPKADAAISVVASPSPVGVVPPLGGLGLPGAADPGTTLAPGGNAAGLFPAISPTTAPAAGSPVDARQAASTSTLPGAADPANAEIAGLAALALAFVLAVTRLSVRRPAAARAAAAAAAAQETPEKSAEDKAAD